jgi:hypothetical protein
VSRHWRAAGLGLILVATASGAERETRIAYFSRWVNTAAVEAGLGKLEIVVGTSDEFNAWVYPPLAVVWVDSVYLRDASLSRLHLTAYHEVCHLVLELQGEDDDERHRAVYGCMKKLMGMDYFILQPRPTVRIR